MPFQTAAAGPGCGPSVSPTARQNVRDTHDTFCSPRPSGVVAGPGGAATAVHREPSQRCAPVVPIARQKVADVQESPVTRPMAAPRGIRHGPPAAVRTSTDGTPLGTGASGGSENEVAAAQNLVPAQDTLASRPLIRGVCCTRYGVVTALAAGPAATASPASASAAAGSATAAGQRRRHVPGRSPDRFPCELPGTGSPPVKSVQAQAPSAPHLSRTRVIRAELSPLRTFLAPWAIHLVSTPASYIELTRPGAATPLSAGLVALNALTGNRLSPSSASSLRTRPSSPANLPACPAPAQTSTRSEPGT